MRTVGALLLRIGGGAFAATRTPGALRMDRDETLGLALPSGIRGAETCH